MFHQNLKYLRKKEGLSQLQLAKVLDCSRSTYRDYENGRIEPNLTLLVKIGEHYQVSLDKLIKEDLEGLEQQNKPYRHLGSIQSEKIRILSTTVDLLGKEHVEIVPIKAKAGYLTGYGDPEFIADLPKMTIPNLPQGTHRAFELEGDSMIPLSHGALVIARYVEHARDLKDNGLYVVVAREGMAFKRIVRKSQSIQMNSFNPVYPPYDIPLEEVMEAWEYVAYYDSTPIQHRMSLDSLERGISEMNEKLNTLLTK